MIGDFKHITMKEFEMTDLGLMSYFLGIEVIQGDDGIFIHQRKFADEFLKKFKMKDSNPVKTPIETVIKLTKEGDGQTIDATYFKQIVRSLRYLTCVEAGGSFFPTKAWCVFDEENGLSALKIVIGF